MSELTEDEILYEYQMATNERPRGNEISRILTVCRAIIAADRAKGGDAIAWRAWNEYGPIVWNACPVPNDVPARYVWVEYAYQSPPDAVPDGLRQIIYNHIANLERTANIVRTINGFVSTADEIALAASELREAMLAAALKPKP